MNNHGNRVLFEEPHFDSCFTLHLAFLALSLMFITCVTSAEAWSATQANVRHNESLHLDFGRLVKKAEQILVGKVVDIRYATSEDRGPGSWIMPHTFVTVHIYNAIFGGRIGDKVTLRFAGGVRDNGNVVIGSHLPRFSVNEDLLLFVAENGKSACPLVSCQRGLLRIFEGRIYDAGGNELLESDRGEIRHGRAVYLPSLHQQRIASMKFSRPFNARWQVRPKESRAMELKLFVKQLQSKVDRIQDRGVYRPSVQSEDPDKPFFIPEPERVSIPLRPAIPIDRE